MSSTQGFLIVLDGIDGTGKATQTACLKTRLESIGKKVITLDFPQYDANVIGRGLKKFLKKEFGDFLALDPKVASAIYAADRRESLPKIEQWLNEGYIIILDRYVSSNMIHQGSKIHDKDEAKKFLKWLDELEHGLMGLPRPHAIVYLDVSAEIASDLLRARAEKEGGTRDEVEGNLAHMVSSRGFALSIVGELGSWIRIDCSNGNGGIKSIDEVHEMVFEQVRPILGL